MLVLANALTYQKLQEVGGGVKDKVVDWFLESKNNDEKRKNNKPVEARRNRGKTEAKYKDSKTTQKAKESNKNYNNNNNDDEDPKPARPGKQKKWKKEADKSIDPENNKTKLGKILESVGKLIDNTIDLPI